MQYAAGVFSIIGSVLANTKEECRENSRRGAKKSSGDVAVRVSPVQKKSIALDFRQTEICTAQQLNLLRKFWSRYSCVADEVAMCAGANACHHQNRVLNIDLETAQASYQNALRDKQRYENAFSTGGVTNSN